MPEKRLAENRIADFDEIYDEFDASEAGTQASRCSQCGVPSARLIVLCTITSLIG